MTSVWITYSWLDNKNQEVDFVAQELAKTGLEVKLDKWTLEAGKELWDQIQDYIQNPAKSDAWIIFATSNSLSSIPCQKEVVFAFDRVQNARGEDFPVIALFPGPVNVQLLPTVTRNRLHVSLKDSDWSKRIHASASNNPLATARTIVEPFFYHVYPRITPRSKYFIEVHPRAGTWSHFVGGVPLEEKDVVNFEIHFGPSGHNPPLSGWIQCRTVGLSPEGLWWFTICDNQATPTESYYFACDKLPSKLLFGPNKKMFVKIV